MCTNIYALLSKEIKEDLKQNEKIDKISGNNNEMIVEKDELLKVQNERFD